MSPFKEILKELDSIKKEIVACISQLSSCKTAQEQIASRAEVLQRLTTAHSALKETLKRVKVEGDTMDAASNAEIAAPGSKIWDCGHFRFIESKKDILRDLLPALVLVVNSPRKKEAQDELNGPE